ALAVHTATESLCPTDGMDVIAKNRRAFVGGPQRRCVSSVSRQFRIRRFAKWSADLRYRKAIVDGYTQMVFTRGLNGWDCGTNSRLSAVHSFSRRQTFGTQFIPTARYRQSVANRYRDKYNESLGG